MPGLNVDASESVELGQRHRFLPPTRQCKPITPVELTNARWRRKSLICTEELELGSRLRKKKICMTARE